MYDKDIYFNERKYIKSLPSILKCEGYLNINTMGEGFMRTMKIKHIEFTPVPDLLLNFFFNFLIYYTDSRNNNYFYNILLYHNNTMSLLLFNRTRQSTLYKKLSLHIL